MTQSEAFAGWTVCGRHAGGGSLKGAGHGISSQKLRWKRGQVAFAKSGWALSVRVH